jgi:hypothetical protein
MFHNCVMTETVPNTNFSKNWLLLGICFAVLSVCVHALFIGWVGGALEVSSWDPPIRDTAISVSLASAKQSDPPRLESSLKIPAVVRQPVRKPQSIPKSEPTQAVEKTLNDRKADVDEPSVIKADPNLETKSDVVGKQDVKVDSQSEPLLESKADKLPLVEPPIYPNGLGAIPVAGAFPYTFFYGDYSLNNALGSGSFIVESGDGKYKLVLIGKASGLTSLLFSGATYRSEGVFGNDGFAPQLYAEKSGNRAERVALVDYSTKEISFGDHKKPTLVGMQDRVSVIWQVGLLLRIKPELVEKGMTLPMPLMSTRGLENAQFVSQGIVEVDKRGVATRAAHFKFKPSNPQNKAQIDLWYDLNNLPHPLRVRWIDERDRTIDIFRDD